MAMALPSAARLRRVGRHVAASAPRPTPSTAATVSVSPTATIHYEAYGDPQHPAIFLAHGAGGNAAVWWRNIPYMVSRGYYVVARKGLSLPRARLAAGHRAPSADRGAAHRRCPRRTDNARIFGTSCYSDDAT